MNYDKYTKNLIEFIRKSPSPFHVVDNFRTLLKESGFMELDERKRFSLEKGRKYFVTRNSTSIIAFTLPETDIKGYSIISAHTDSPGFRLKPNPEVTSSGEYTTLNIEGYGGMLLSPWFDRPLSIAGRAFVKRGEEVKEELVDFDEDLVTIVNLAIHQNRKANEGINYKVQKELLPLFALGNEKGTFTKYLAKKLNAEEKDVLDADLFLYNRTPASIWGLNKEFFSSSKIDDLGCAYNAIAALKDSKESSKIQMVALFDNEEVGSGTKQGALSDFLKSTLDRIAYALSFDEEKRLMLIQDSFMLSADNGHALHPNYPEVCDIVNKPILNKGILIKYSANQKYTTDASSGAFVKQLCLQHDIPYQIFVNNSDVPGGSTLGNLSSQRVSIRTADVGICQLAMHSPYESAGCKDNEYLFRLFEAFLNNC